jgi:hypothetical protein
VKPYIDTISNYIINLNNNLTTNYTPLTTLNNYYQKQYVDTISNYIINLNNNLKVYVKNDGATNTFLLGSGSSSVTTGYSNFSAGALALNALTSGYGNCCIGANAGLTLNSGVENFVLGYNSMKFSTSASYNVVIGVNSGANLSTASYNVLIGRFVGSANNSGNDNVSIGYFSNLNGTSSNNVTIGSYSGSNLSTGSNNCFIGTVGLQTGISTGNNNTMIGNSTTSSANNYNNSTCIGYNSKILFSNGIFLGTASETTYPMGNVFINNNILLCLSGSISVNNSIITPQQLSFLNNVTISNKITSSTISDINNYQLVSGMSSYLLSSTASTTYQTQSNALTYLTISSALINYLTQSNASATYQTQSNALNYLTISSGLSLFLTKTNASSTYLSQTNAATIYQTIFNSGNNLETNYVKNLRYDSTNNNVYFSNISITAGQYNTLMGIDAGYQIFNSSVNNSYFGWNAGYSTYSGCNNCVFGFNSMSLGTGQNNNSVFGYASAGGLQGNNNAIFGDSCAGSAITNNNCSCFGSGISLNDGLSFCTVIGSGANGTTSNSIILGRTNDVTYCMGGLNIPSNKTLTLLGSITANSLTVTPAQLSFLSNVTISNKIQSSTISDINNFLTVANASTTYQTQSAMSSYQLTSGMSSYQSKIVNSSLITATTSLGSSPADYYCILTPNVTAITITLPTPSLALLGSKIIFRRVNTQMAPINCSPFILGLTNGSTSILLSNAQYNCEIVCLINSATPTYNWFIIRQN